MGLEEMFPAMASFRDGPNYQGLGRKYDIAQAGRL